MDGRASVIALDVGIKNLRVKALGFIGMSQALRATRAEKEQIELRREAESEKRKAQTEAGKATAISDLLQQMLSSANPAALSTIAFLIPLSP